MNQMIIPVRHIRGTLVLVLACMAAGVWTSKACAEEPTTAEAVGERATKFFRQGNVAFEQKKWAEAEAAYLQAWRLARTFDVAANLGEVSLRLGKPRDAARYLAFSLRAAPPSAKPAQRERTRHFLGEAKKEVGTIRLRVNVADARVTIDGVPLEPDEIAHELFVNPGTHTILAQRDGYQDAQATVRASAGSAQDATLSLAPPRRSIVPGVVLGSVAGAALVTGVVLLVEGAKKRGDARDLSASISDAHHSCVMGAGNHDPRCSQLDNTAKSAGTFHDAGVGVMVGAGVAAVGAVTYFLWPASAPSRPIALRFTPTASATSAGVLFSGSF